MQFLRPVLRPVLRPAVRRLVVRGPRTVRLLAAHTLTGSEGTLYDSVTWQNMPRVPGAAYAGYVDGAFANWSTIVQEFSGHDLLSITVFGNTFARCIDDEPGDATNAELYHWRTTYASQFTQIPVVYTMASNMSAVQRTMKANGFVQGRDYLLWSAHYIGYHLCGPGTCGYGDTEADATQYASSDYDTSVTKPGFFNPITPPTPVPAPPVTEDEDDEMILLPGTNQPPVGKSFPSANAYATVGFVGDPSFVGAVITTVRLAFHLVGGGWSVVNAVVGTGAGAKTVISIPANSDGVSASRLDNVQVTLIPNFA